MLRTSKAFIPCPSLPSLPEEHDRQEEALAPVMPALVTWPAPALDAARRDTRIHVRLLLRCYGISTVSGDRYAGECPSCRC